MIEAASDKRGRIIILGAMVLCFLIGILANTHNIPFPFMHIDEQAHASYAHYLLNEHRWWPDFRTFYMEDGTTRNYLNHTPLFYWSAKLLNLTDGKELRLFALVFYMAAIGLYARIGLAMKQPLLLTTLFALFPFLLSMQTMSGFYTNDAWAIFGGLLCCAGSYEWLSDISNKRSWSWMLIGLLFASAKFTSFLLVGLYIVFLLCGTRQHRMLFRPSLVIAALIACTPYAFFLWQWGSVVPETIGQQDMLQHLSQDYGFITASRMHLVPWIVFALGQFANQFGGPEFTFLPLLLLIASWAVLLVFPEKNAEGRLTRAALYATLVTLVIHLFFSYQRYLQYGWLKDFYVRYYFPLLPIYGLTVIMACSRLHSFVRKEVP